MRLKTPSFWYEPAGLRSAALKPASWLYQAGYNIHHAVNRPYKASVPLLCIGNLVAGGSGKTPVTLALMDLVRDNRLAANPCFLSRGYGGAQEGPLQVDPHRHNFHDVGDEPLLLADKAPAFISKNRKKGILAAQEKKHDLILMDDGLQNPAIAPDISLMVIDGATGFGNGQLLPAGPLRETVETGTEKADAFIIVGGDRHNVTQDLPLQKPIFRAALAVDEKWQAQAQTTYIAFTGIARPEKFKANIEAAGITLAGWHGFPDHYPYSWEDLDDLNHEAVSKKAHLLTTQKDAVRIPAEYPWRTGLDVMPVRIQWEKPDELHKFLAQKINEKRSLSR
jgi:tetraacyldisaccharide 4'-kinase